MASLSVVNLSEGVTSPARLQNRTCEFPRIRLLNDWVFDTDTFGTASVPVVMAMPVQEKFVAEFFPSAFTSGRNMIDFDHICVLEEQATPATFPFLLAQQGTLDPIEEGVRFQSLAPVEEITVIRTGCSLHFDMPLDMGLSVFPQRCLLVSEVPALSFVDMPVFVRNPVPSFLGMAAFSPAFQLQIEHMVASMECP